MIRGHLEIPDERTLAVFDKVDFSILRKKLFEAIIDQCYPGSKLEDISLVPRVLPHEYMVNIEDACQKLTDVVLKIASKDCDFILRYLLPDSRWDKLINQYGLLDRLPTRMIGELRYDFALCGPLCQENRPLLMEVNAGALGGIAHADFIPKVIKQQVAGLDHLTHYDLGRNFVGFCERIGQHIANFTIGEYSWGEDILSGATAGKIDFHLVTPIEISDIESWPKLMKATWRFDTDHNLYLYLGDRWQKMDGFRWGRILEHRDIDRFGRLFEMASSGSTTFISPLRVDYICHKGILPLLSNKGFLREELSIDKPDLITKYVPPSWNLSEVGFPLPREREGLVLKQNFGCSGKKVFVGNSISKMEGRIDKPRDWILQKRLELNQMFARLLYSQDQPLKMDLGVFVHYDYIDGKLDYCRIAGMVSRGSPGDRVNLNLGGSAIPLFVLNK